MMAGEAASLRAGILRQATIQRISLLQGFAIACACCTCHSTNCVAGYGNRLSLHQVLLDCGACQNMVSALRR